MIMDILGKLNIVDILVIILYARICVIASRKGIAVEIFKLAGLICAIYLSLHYYTAISDYLRSRVSLKVIPLDFLDFFIFLILAGSVYLIFAGLRQTFLHLVKIEAVSGLHKWGGLVLGVCRAYLLVGLVVFCLGISTVNYLKESAQSSYMGKKLFRVPVETYSWLWDNIFSKFSSPDKFNKVVKELEEDFLRE
jgi:uncharacterized membrane protein required for colicin V production